MKIFVTGGAGFIGSAVVRLAVSRGYDVMNFDALMYAGNLANLATVADKPNYSFVHGDIRNSQALKDAICAFAPDIVMHLAAESHVDRSISGPEAFITTNIVGTYNLLHVALDYWRSRQEFEAFRFLHVSTDEVYGSLGAHGKFTEETPYDPTSPYSSSKASSDFLVRAWGKTYGLPIMVSNCSNNFGPYQFPEKLIPVVIINALQKRKIPIYGEGTNVRDWLYVEDHAAALFDLISRGRLGRTYNIGGNNEVQNLHLVRDICKILDAEKMPAASFAELISFVKDRPAHDQRYAIDTSRIKEEIGWEPKHSFEEALDKTVKWYLANENWWRDALIVKSPQSK